MAVGPQRRGSKVVEAIVTATLEHVAKSGIHGFSVDDVAASAGVNKTTVYRRWPTRDDLLAAALRAESSRLLVDPDTGSVREDLFALGQLIAREISSVVGRALFQALLDNNPVAIRFFEEMRADVQSIPRRILRRAIARNELPKNVPISLMLDAFAGGLHQNAIGRRGPPSDAFIRKLVDFTLGGAIAVATKTNPEKGKSED